jgi:hypothetical protein
MKAELIKFKIHSSKFNDNKWKTISISDDLTWLKTKVDLEKTNYYWFTGYKDTANNEMFEGDIIKFTSNSISTIGHIEYRRDRNRNGFYVTTTGNIKYLLLNEFFIEGSKPLIIGNIIDHRHLIEKR